MGNRRLGRKRLYTIEKAGQDIDLGTGAGISPAIARTTQSRLGNELITEIVVDLGTDLGDIEAPGTDRHAIGVDAKAAAVAELSIANVGVVTEVRCVVLEDPAGGCADVDLEFAAAGTHNGGANPSGTSIMTSLTTKGEDTSTAYDNNALAGKWLYICAGETGSNADMTAGKFVIYIYGYAVPDDL